MSPTATPTPELALTFTAPCRVSVTLEDGTVKVLDAMAVQVHGAIRRKAPGANRIVSPQRDTPSSLRRYPVPALALDVIKDARSGKEDGIADAERAMFIICNARKAKFNLSEMPTYSVADMQILGSAIKNGVKVSTMVKAVVVAAEDDYWRVQGDIDIKPLISQVSKLLGRYENVMGKVRATKMLDDLIALDPTAIELRANLDAAKSDHEAKRVMAEIQGRLTKMRAG